ncbi:MAG: FAD-dependent monooxygenase [Deltaproteobacteria bacterium]|nr:FAD-dependent monooxygenase [Deltaproteobacteria bacterium]
MSSGEPEILIVGGGPAGLSTWLHLHEEDRGLAAATLLIERATFPRDKVCAGGIIPEADRVLRDLRIQLPIPSVLVRNVDYLLGERRLRSRQSFRVVRRVEFDHALARVAVQRGLKLQEGESFRLLERNHDRLLVWTSKAQYRVRALVGADGALSSVRRSMNLREGNQRISRGLEVVTPSSRGDGFDAHAATAVLDFTPMAEDVQGYIWDFPCLVAGTPSHNRGIYDSATRALHPPVRLGPILGNSLREGNSPQNQSSWLGHPGRWFAPDGVYAQPNILLVGDAAGAEPLIGEGISCALRYGRIAAHHLCESFRKGDFSFKGYRESLLASSLGVALTLKAITAREIYGCAPEQLSRMYHYLSRQLHATPVSG